MYENKPSIDELMHYGMPRRSGRYPWGSGKDPYQHCTDFLSRVKYLSDNGISDEDICKSLGLTKQEFEIEKSFAMVHDMVKQGKSEKEIAEALGTTTTKVRLQKTMIKDGHRAVEVDIAKELREQGYSLNEIAKQMGYKMNHERMDTILMSRSKLSHLRAHNLKSSCGYLGIELIDAHRAVNDTIATAQVFLKLL